MASRFDFGNKSYVDAQEFFARVTGGGIYGPGHVDRFDGIKWRTLPINKDKRSGRSRGSGYVTFDTAEPGLYRYTGIAISNIGTNTGVGYFEHTVDAQIVELNERQMQQRQGELYPGFAAILDARHALEQVNAQRQADYAIQQAQERIEREAQYLRRITARKQTEIIRHMKNIKRQKPIVEQDGFIQRDTFIRRAIEKNGKGTFGYEQIPSGIFSLDDPIIITCPKHRPFLVNPTIFLDGQGCPVCEGSLGLT
jgi:hypothetical protein